MKRSRIIDPVPKDFVLPEASEENAEHEPSADLVGQKLQVGDLSSKDRIRVRSPMLLPSWLDQVFQKPPEGPVSTSWAPEHLEGRSSPSIHNRLSSPSPSDAEGQPGASQLWLGEQELEVYKKPKPGIDRGCSVSCGSGGCSVCEVAEVESSEEFDSTEEFEEGDEEQALLYFTKRAVVSSSHSSRAIAVAAEAWRRKEQLKIQEIRRRELLKIEAAEEEELEQCCSVRTFEVRFKEISVFARRILFPCEAEFDPEIEFSDSDSEDDFE